MKKKKLTLMQALEAAGAPPRSLRADSKLYHALGAIIARQPDRFASTKDGRRVLVDPAAVAIWLEQYQPRQPRPARAQITIYLRDRAHRRTLRHLASQVGRPSISAAINDWAEGSLELVERFEEQPSGTS